MQFMSNGINQSPTIAAPASVAMTEPGGKAVKLNADGAAVLCSTAGEAVIGIVTIDNDNDVKAGETVSIQVKDNGVAKIGAAVAVGAELAVNASGLFVTATTGQYVRAIALEKGAAANDIIRVMMVNYVK